MPTIEIEIITQIEIAMIVEIVTGPGVGFRRAMTAVAIGTGVEIASDGNVSDGNESIATDLSTSIPERTPVTMAAMAAMVEAITAAEMSSAAIVTGSIEDRRTPGIAGPSILTIRATIETLGAVRTAMDSVEAMLKVTDSTGGTGDIEGNRIPDPN